MIFGQHDPPNPNGATMENVQEMPGNLGESQKFTTTKRGLEMTNKMIKNYDKLNVAAGGAQELIALLNMGAHIPDAIKNTGDYVQAAKDVKAIDGQAMRMDDAINYVDSSGINMTTQTRNDVVNFVFDGTLPPGTDTQNGLIIQNGLQILRNNNLPINPSPEQEKANKKRLR